MENSMNRFSHFSPMIMPSSSRSINASSAERSLLLNVIASHLGVLDARDNDSRTLRQKGLLWDQVTKKFNSLSSMPRSRHQIQTLYKNMKAKAKKYQLRFMEAQLDNVPHAIPEPDPISEVLLQLLASEHEQRRIQINQTAFNVSADVSSTLSGDEDNRDPFSELQDPASVECSPDIVGSITEVKSEATNSGQSSIEQSLLGEEPVLRQCGSKSPEKEILELFSHSADDGVSRPSSINDQPPDEPNTQQQPKTGVKRPRLALPLFTDTSRALFENLWDSSDRIHNLKITDTHLPIHNSVNRHCCCQSLHNELVTLAKEEHSLRVRIAEEERRLKLEHHKEKMNLLELEQELCRRKLKLTDKILKSTKTHEDSNDENLNTPLVIALNLLENLCHHATSSTASHLNPNNES